MPFTFSHPAIVFPLTYLPKKWFSLTGLVVGSLTPDFEYFLRMKVKSIYSHNAEGLFWFDLPLGLLLAFVFHNIVRDSLFENLPTILKSRFLTFKQFNWNEYFRRNWFVVTASIVIGAVSHLLWDSFSHVDGFFVQTIPFLHNSANFFGRNIYVFKIVQHSSTLFGGLLIAFAVYKLPTSSVKNNYIDWKYWFIITSLSLAIVALKPLTGLELKHFGNIIVTMISAGLISLVLTPWLLKRNRTTNHHNRI